MGPYLKVGLLQIEQVKMLYGMRLVPQSNMTVSLQKECHMQKQTLTGSAYMKLEFCCHKPRNYQRLGERPGIDLSLAPQP
jgi:hypothetical protein